MSMMGMFTRPVAPAKRTEGSADWRSPSAVQKGLSLKGDNQFIDCSRLDESASTLERMVDSGASSAGQLDALTRFMTRLHEVIQESETAMGAYSFRKRLVSLEYRSLAVYRELKRGERAPEFNDKALRRIVKDYMELRD